jgi:hypothetical protein
LPSRFDGFKILDYFGVEGVSVSLPADTDVFVFTLGDNSEWLNSISDPPLPPEAPGSTAVTDWPTETSGFHTVGGDGPRAVGRWRAWSFTLPAGKYTVDTYLAFWAFKASIVQSSVSQLYHDKSGDVFQNPFSLPATGINDTTGIYGGFFTTSTSGLFIETVYSSPSGTHFNTTISLIGKSNGQNYDIYTRTDQNFFKLRSNGSDLVSSTPYSAFPSNTPITLRLVLDVPNSKIIGTAKDANGTLLHSIEASVTGLVSGDEYYFTSSVGDTFDIDSFVYGNP